MPIEAPQEIGLEEQRLSELPIMPPGAVQPRVPVGGSLGGQRLIGYPGIDEATMREYQARGAEQDRQFIEAMVANSRLQDAQKAIEAAIRFQAMRQFDRDIQIGRASGFSPEQATLQALSKNAGRMFFNAPGSAERAIRQTMPPSVFQGQGVEPFAVGPSGTPTRLSRPVGPPRAFRSPGGVEFATFGNQMRVLNPTQRSQGLTAQQQLTMIQKAMQIKMDEKRAEEDPNSPKSKQLDAEIAQLRARMGELQGEYLGVGGAPAPQPRVIAPPGAQPEASPVAGTPAPEAAAQGRRAWPKVGAIVKGYRFNGRYIPSDRRAWDRVQ